MSEESRKAFQDAWVEYLQNNGEAGGPVDRELFLAGWNAHGECELEQSKWISVEEKLPKDGIEVMVFSPGRGVTTDWRETCDVPSCRCGTVWSVADMNERIVTHWRPFPAPPSEAKP